MVGCCHPAARTRSPTTLPQLKEIPMRALIATVSLALLSTLAHAQSACESKAAEKKLAGDSTPP